MCVCVGGGACLFVYMCVMNQFLFGSLVIDVGWTQKLLLVVYTCP